MQRRQLAAQTQSDCLNFRIGSRQLAYARRVKHDRFGWWVEEAGSPDLLGSLDGNLSCDVAIVGGGYLGLWTAWQIKQLEPNATVVVLEAERCGFGPSGRNGGFVNCYWAKVPWLAAEFGSQAALALGRAAADSVAAIGSWCEDNSVDAWYRAAPHVEIATSAAQEGDWAVATAGCADLGLADQYYELSREQVAEIVESPVFGAGAAMIPAATVQPARLCFGLREAVLGSGVRIFEQSRVNDFAEGEGAIVLRTAGGSVRSRNAVYAINSAMAGFRETRNSVSIGSSHIVLTEPVPDILEAIGWTGHQGLSDCRTMLHYFRTTEDHRIAFGWGGGRMGTSLWDRSVTEVDRQAVRLAAEALRRFFPALEGREITHAWGGPIDVSSTRLPQFRQIGQINTGFGFTGNGVGPSYLGGQILARMALDRRDEFTNLLLVEQRAKHFPPEPLRFVGGSAIRAAMVRSDRANDVGETPGWLTSAVASIPNRLGMHLPR